MQNSRRTGPQRTVLRTLPRSRSPLPSGQKDTQVLRRPRKSSRQMQRPRLYVTVVLDPPPTCPNLSMSFRHLGLRRRRVHHHRPARLCLFRRRRPSHVHVARRCNMEARQAILCTKAVMTSGDSRAQMRKSTRACSASPSDLPPRRSLPHRITPH